MMDSDFFRWSLFLMAAVVLTLAAHVRSLGINKAGTFLALVGSGLVVAVIGYGEELAHVYRHVAASTVVWVALFIVTALAGLDARRAQRHSEDARIVRRSKTVALSLWLTAAYSLFSASCLALQSSGWFAAGIAVAGLAAWVALGIGSTALAENLDAQGGARPWIARLHAFSCWAALLLPFVGGMLASSVEMAALAVVAGLALPISSPFVVAFLVGLGPTPRDLQAHVRSIDATTPRRLVTHRPKPTALGIWFAFALASQLFLVQRHLEHCAGELVSVPSSLHWQDLPVLVSDSPEKLGPFNFRASHLNNKSGPPTPYNDAALSDPGACFASNISLASWFDGNGERSPSELRLRQSANGDTFFVSARDGEAREELLLAAFQRRLSPRWQFDTVGSACVFWLGGLLTVVGSAFAAQGLRRRGNIGRSVSLSCFVVTTTLALLHESYWAADSTPKPGRELAVDGSSWII